MSTGRLQTRVGRLEAQVHPGAAGPLPRIGDLSDQELIRTHQLLISLDAGLEPSEEEELVGLMLKAGFDEQRVVEWGESN